LRRPLKPEHPFQGSKRIILNFWIIIFFYRKFFSWKKFPACIRIGSEFSKSLAPDPD
jgi:hypothetical protein